MENLIIVESPSKSKTIEKYLGKDYTVVSSKGHIRDLAVKGKDGLGVDVEDNFKPTYVVSKDKKQTVSDLKKLAKSAKHIYLATDPDREGEAISWHLADELGIDMNDKNRIEFQEITKNAVLKALDNPRKIDMALVKSQETRRILDRILGFRLSKLLRSKIKSQSAGRVQSVALRIICDREHEIEKFKAEEYWTVKLNLKDKKEFEASLSKIDDKKADLKNEKDADDVLNKVKDKITLSNITKKLKKRAPYLPFITSTLQQEASTKLGFNSKRTMMVAQTLYEGVSVGKNITGLITYMRTDSTRLSKDFTDSAFEYIETNYGKEYKGTYRVKNDANSQDAHEAIRPTSLENEPDKIKDYLTNDQYKLYRFIYYRALASLMAEATFDTVSYEFRENNLTFVSNGSTLNFDGFLKVYEKYDSSKDVNLPKLKDGQELDVINKQKEQHFTEAPSRYTEAKLIKALEEEGVGRPSTYAMIIDTIEKREYVELKKTSETSKTKVFFPTEQGILTDDKLKEFFIDVINVKYTAEMEKELDEIALNKLDYLVSLHKFYDAFIPLIDNAQNNMEKIEAEKTGEKCPDCGGDLVIRKGKFGKFVACSNYPKCKYIKKDEVKKEDLEKTGEKCPDCGGDLVKRKGRYGEFVSCINYPTCKYIKKEALKEVEGTCPTCGSKLVEKWGRFGKFIACSNYPECKYIVGKKGTTKSPAEKIGRACPECGKDLVKRISRRGAFIACSGFPKCRYTEKIDES